MGSRYQNKMKHHFIILVLGLASAEFSMRRKGRPSTTIESETTTTDPSEDVYMSLVKAYIDAGTCGEVSKGSLCGDEATSYYKEFEYLGERVIITNSIPDHEAETDAVEANPNTRCERWMFMSVPLSPEKGSSVEDSEMGVTGLAVTGGTFYNYLSTPAGDVALYNEGSSLDSCMGHSSYDGQYHYHANILCDLGSAAGASEADTCLLIGYMRDGVAVYGACKDSDGVLFTSCYSLRSGATEETITTAGGDFDSASMTKDYYYDTDAFDTGACNLDESNGGVHPTTGQYSYFMTTTYPWLPVYYYGAAGAQSLCAAA